MGLSMALFSRMARESTIARRWVVASTSVGFAAALVVWLFAEPFIRFAFSSRYLGATHLVLPLALAQVIRGTTNVYNTFLGAHARGRELRKANVMLTASNLVLNFALIPTYGATGAAWASVVALVVNLAAHVFYYRQAVTEIATAA